MVKYVNIAEVPLVFQIPYEVRSEERFLPFLSKGSCAAIQIRLIETEVLPTFNEATSYKENNYIVYTLKDGTQWRAFFWHNHNNLYYAASRIGQKDQENIIYCLPEGRMHVNHLNGLMYHICWEQILLEHNRIIFHSACVSTEYGGLLFSGPSGIGKSTQGNLWCRHEGAELINGDRPILGKTQDGWFAYGSPYAGSSECFKNKKVPIRAIIMLQQSGFCRIRKLSAVQAFRLVLEQVTANQWDQSSMQRVCDLVTDLIMKIPVFLLHCTPDRDAIDCLKGVFREDIENASD